MQKVYLSETRDGRRGLFTAGLLVIELVDPEKYQQFVDDPDHFCSQLELEYVERTR